MDGKTMISMDKQYRTENGMKVRILCVDRVDDLYPVIALVDNHRVVEYTVFGKFLGHGLDDPRDLVEVTQWDDFKIDEPVMVRMDHHHQWERRYFAGVDDSKPTVWPNGTTSFSSPTKNKARWNECRRPTEDELKGQ